MRALQRSFGQIKKNIAPHNQREPIGDQNPFKIGELVLLAQQAVDRDHKFSPKWKGPFKVTRIVNRFQIEYEEEGIKKKSNVRYCKKYHEEYLPEDVKVGTVQWE